jgi:ATP-dependent helicase YprA (DUF1998 family)
MFNRKKKAQRELESVKELFANGETLIVMTNALNEAHQDIDTLLTAIMHGGPPAPWDVNRSREFLKDLGRIQTQSRQRKLQLIEQERGMWS